MVLVADVSKAVLTEPIGGLTIPWLTNEEIWDIRPAD